MGPFRFLSTALLLIQATAFAPILPNSLKKTSSSLIFRLGAKDGDLFASISKLAAALKDPKRALYQAIAGDYDEEAIKKKVEALIADEPVLMFSQTT
jgi:ABC-type branched-subunit amino acid transport system substrate-binding protein